MSRAVDTSVEITLTLTLRRAGDGGPDYVMVEREGMSYYVGPDVEDAPESLVRAVAYAVLSDLKLLRELADAEPSSKVGAS